MSAPRIPRPLKVGKVDQYFIDVDPDWLGAEQIASVTVASGGSAVTVGLTEISGSRISFTLTGVSAGSAVLDIDYSTSGGRSDCKHVTVFVVEC